MSGLNSRHLFLTHLEVEQTKIRALADSVSDAGLLPGSQTTLFSLCPHMVERWLATSLASSYNGINPIHKGSIFMTNYLQKATLPKTTTLEIGFN